MIIKNANRNLFTQTTFRRNKTEIGLANNKEKNGLWKGNSVGLSALHNWIRRNKPKPEFYEKWHFKN